MATIIWCDRARHIVEESRTIIETFMFGEDRADDFSQPEFIYVTPVNATTQRALRTSAITSFEAVPGDGI